MYENLVAANNQVDDLQQYMRKHNLEVQVSVLFDCCGFSLVLHCSHVFQLLDRYFTEFTYLLLFCIFFADDMFHHLFGSFCFFVFLSFAGFVTCHLAPIYKLVEQTDCRTCPQSKLRGIM